MTIHPVSATRDAYQKPQGFSTDEMLHDPHYVKNGDFATGAAIGALGQLLQEAENIDQQNKFELNNHQAIARAEASTPKNLTSLVHRSVRSSIKNDPLFQVEQNGLSHMSISIDSYGYIKTNQSHNTTLLSPAITASVKLTSSNSKTLLDKTFTATSNIQAPLSKFISDRNLASQAYQNAAADLSNQLSAELNKKAGEAKQISTTAAPITYKPDLSTNKSKNSSYKIKQLKSVQTYVVTDSSPYKLTQDYHFLYKAGKKVKLGGYTFKIAGNDSGNVVLVMQNNMLSTKKFTSTGCVEYTLIKNYLTTNNIKIIRQRDVRNTKYHEGFFLELNGDGYSKLLLAN